MKGLMEAWGRANAPLEPEFGVLMVCMGNICRSPTAQAVLEARVKALGLGARVRVASAGTHAYHVGSPPDARAQHHARLRGLNLSGLRARKITPDDFARFDLLLAMDLENLQELRRLAPAAYQGRVKLLMDFARVHRGVQEVPDPYYGTELGFERVLDLVGDACEGLAGILTRLLALPGRLPQAPAGTPAGPQAT